MNETPAHTEAHHWRPSQFRLRHRPSPVACRLSPVACPASSGRAPQLVDAPLPLHRSRVACSRKASHSRASPRKSKGRAYVCLFVRNDRATLSRVRRGARGVHEEAHDLLRDEGVPVARCARVAGEDSALGVDTVSVGEIFRAQKKRVARQTRSSSRALGSGATRSSTRSRSASTRSTSSRTPEARGDRRRRGEAGQARADLRAREPDDVDAATHPYISTGAQNWRISSAFPVGRARDLYRRAQALPSLEIVGLDCHIGSQLTQTQLFAVAIARMIELVRALGKDGIQRRFARSISGAVWESPYEENAGDPFTGGVRRSDRSRVASARHDLDLHIVCEPGRVIVGNAGVLLTETLST